MEHLVERWGWPKRVRVDNGWPWGAMRDLPPVFCLWLWGHGCEVIWNRPAHPQENAKVERGNGLFSSWGEPERCANWQAWAEKVAWVVHTQRERYPHAHGQSRLGVHPELETNPRRPAGDGAAAWELARVQTQLANGLWRRQVNRVGQVSLYRRTCSVGRAWAGQEVWVRFAAESHAWVFLDRKGQEIKRRPAAELTRERILALDVSYFKPKERARQRQNIPAHYLT